MYFGKKIKVGVLVVSGLRNLYVVSSISLSSCILLTNVLICSSICWVGSMIFK